MSWSPIPHFSPGQLITAADMNRMIDRVNEQLGWCVCAHCGRTHREGNCPGCGANRPPAKDDR